jgi:hypothetical protein
MLDLEEEVRVHNLARSPLLMNDAVVNEQSFDIVKATQVREESLIDKGGESDINVRSGEDCYVV